MTQPTSPDPSSSQKLKTLMTQGLIGAVSLAGATAIPILIKQFLEPPTAHTTPPASVSSPAPSIPAASPVAATPIPVSAPIATVETPTLQEANSSRETSSVETDKHQDKNQKGRGKNK